MVPRGLNCVSGNDGTACAGLDGDSALALGLVIASEAFSSSSSRAWFQWCVIGTQLLSDSSVLPPLVHKSGHSWHLTIVAGTHSVVPGSGDILTKSPSLSGSNGLTPNFCGHGRTSVYICFCCCNCCSAYDCFCFHISSCSFLAVRSVFLRAFQSIVVQVRD